MRIHFYASRRRGRKLEKLAERDWPSVPHRDDAVMLRLAGGDEFHGVVLSVQWGDVRGSKAPLAVVALEVQP